MNPANNPPVTAASIVAAILGVITAFDIGHLTTEQTAAVAAVCALLAGFAAQHFTTPWIRRDADPEHDEHADPDELHAGPDR